MICDSVDTRSTERCGDSPGCPTLDLAPLRHWMADLSKENASLQRSQDMVVVVLLLLLLLLLLNNNN